MELETVLKYLELKKFSIFSNAMLILLSHLDYFNRATQTF